MFHHSLSQFVIHNDLVQEIYIAELSSDNNHGVVVNGNLSLRRPYSSKFVVQSAGTSPSPKSTPSPPAMRASPVQYDSGSEQRSSEFALAFECKGTSVLVEKNSSHKGSRILKGRYKDHYTGNYKRCVIKRATDAATADALRKEMKLLSCLLGYNNPESSPRGDDSGMMEYDPEESHSPAEDYVVKILYGHDSRFPYFVMEYFPQELTAALDPDCDGAVCEKLAKHLVNAVTYIHSRNIMHGDIKPQNILYRPTKFDYEVKLCDFDSARDVEMGELFPYDTSGAIKYSSGYECPEYFSAHKCEQLRSSYALDYFTLGLVFHQLFNNDANPFFHGKSIETKQELLTDQHKLHERLCSVKHCTSMGKVIEQLCQLNPADRALNQRLVNEALGISKTDFRL
jgi:hypothetical protein